MQTDPQLQSTAHSVRRRNRLARIVVIAICILGVAKFTARLSSRSHLTTGGRQHDLEINYIAARAWMRGLNPYDHGILSQVWADSGGKASEMPLRTKTPEVYPPAALVLFSPVMMTSWDTSRVLWRMVSISALVLLIVCLHRLAGIRFFELRSFCLIAGTLALEPITTALWLGQPSILVAAFGAASLVYAVQEHGPSSGVFEGLALSFKPQVAIAFAAPFVIARRWKTCVAAVATIAILTWIALVHVGSPSQCIASWVSNLHFAFDAGGENDPVQLVNTARIWGKNWADAPIALTDFVNLQYPLRTFIDSSSAVSMLTWLIASALAFPVLIALIRQPRDIELLHAVSNLAMLELLVFYHRSHDAVVVALPLAWALSPRVAARWSWPVLVSCSVFWLPIGGILSFLDRSHLIPSWLTSGPFWRSFVLPIQAWTLFGIATWLAICLTQWELSRIKASCAATDMAPLQWFRMELVQQHTRPDRI